MVHHKFPREHRDVVSSSEWVRHFQGNKWNPDQFDWPAEALLAAEERAAIVRSVQVFQLGESGEGRHFLRVAGEWAAESGDTDYVRALKLFVEEEQTHAAALACFLRAAGEPRIGHNWTNGVFCWLRHRAGLELTITVLVTAEIIARVYYPMLRRATSVPALRRLCEQISRDEVAHIRFQGQRLGVLRQHHGPVRWRLTLLLQKLLFDVTSVLVWFAHRSVFRRAQVSWRRYWLRTRAEYRAARRQVEIGAARKPKLRRADVSGRAPKPVFHH